MLPLRPRPYRGESFSSWMLRLSKANGRSPNQLLSAIGCDGISRPLVDPELRITNLDAQLVSAATRTSTAEVIETSLRKYEGDVVPGFEGELHPGWVIAPGYRQHIRGSMYCPICLEEMGEPYFRLVWRLGFYAVCPSHDRVLEDTCPHCHHFIWFLHLSPDDLGAFWRAPNLCVRCGGDIRKQPSILVNYESSDAHECLRLICESFESAHLVAPFKPFVYRFQFFEGLRSIITVLSSKRGRQLAVCIHNLSGMTLPIQDFWHRPVPFERRSRAERYWLASAAAWVLADWPQRFIRTGELASATEWTYTVDRKSPLPYWVFEVVKERFYSRRYSPSKSEIKSAINQLQRNNNRLSKIKIKQLMGITEAAALNDLVSVPRRKLNTKEADTFFGRAMKDLMKAPETRGHKDAYVRDLLVVLISALTGLKIENICKWSYNQLDQYEFVDQRCKTALHAKWSKETSLLFRDYIRKIRPRIVGSAGCDRLFVSREGAALRGAALRTRIVLLIKRLGPPDVWPSADVLRGVFLSSGNR